MGHRASITSQKLVVPRLQGPVAPIRRPIAVLRRTDGSGLCKIERPCRSTRVVDMALTSLSSYPTEVFARIPVCTGNGIVGKSWKRPCNRRCVPASLSPLLRRLHCTSSLNERLRGSLLTVLKPAKTTTPAPLSAPLSACGSLSSAAQSQTDHICGNLRNLQPVDLTDLASLHLREH